jgi:hypothetical protein
MELTVLVNIIEEPVPITEGWHDGYNYNFCPVGFCYR